MDIERIRSAVAIARMNADNDNYQCGVSIAEVEEILAEIKTLRNAALEQANDAARWRKLKEHVTTVWMRDRAYWRFADIMQTDDGIDADIDRLP